MKKKYNPKKDIYNAEHPLRRLAIETLEEIEDDLGVEINGVQWYRLEDYLTLQFVDAVNKRGL